MKSRILSIKEFRQNIFKALDDVDENLTQYVLTKNGKPKAIVMNLDEMEALMETYDILADRELMKQINAYRKTKRKRLIDWNKVKANLI